MTFRRWKKSTKRDHVDEMAARRRKGASFAQIASEFDVTRSYVRQLVGSIKPDPHPGPAEVYTPTLPTVRELDERRRVSREVLNHDPDVLRCRAERAKRAERDALRKAEQLEALRAEIVARMARDATQSNRQRSA